MPHGKAVPLELSDIEPIRTLGAFSPNYTMACEPVEVALI
jgi:hypothetical protein